MPWRDLLQRVYAVDVFCCPTCGGRRRLIAVITRPDSVRHILDHLGIGPRLPSPRPARAPPDLQLQLPLPAGDRRHNPPCLAD